MGWINIELVSICRSFVAVCFVWVFIHSSIHEFIHYPFNQEIFPVFCACPISKDEMNYQNLKSMGASARQKELRSLDVVLKRATHQ